MQGVNVARVVKNAIFNAVGSCVDLVAVAVPEDARVQAVRKLAMREAGRREDEVLQAIEGIGLVQACECLAQIRAALRDNAPPEVIKKLAAQVDAHDRCERTGFLNTIGRINMRVVTDAEAATPPEGLPTVADGAQERKPPVLARPPKGKPAKARS